MDECAQEFGVDIVWVEGYPSDKGKGWSVVHKVVSYETAARKGEPFEAMIKKLGIPSTNAPFCSDQLKRKTIESYLRSIGWRKSSYIKAIGIRNDEPKRYTKTIVANGKKQKVRIVKKGVVWPLIDWFPVDKVWIKQWWAERGFYLDIHPDDGNCDRCWKKDIYSLCRSAIRKPDSYKWWQDMTDKYGHLNPRDSELKTPFNFYRGNISPKDIFTLSLLPESEMAAMAKREKLDGCAESCEAF